MPTAPLEYAPAPSRRRRAVRRAFRVIILSALIVGVATSYRWGPPAWERAQLLYWQRKCLTYAEPADRIVWDDQASQPHTLSSLANPPAPVPARACLVKFDQFVAGAPTLLFRGPVAFLHERRSRGGTVRLIAVPAQMGGFFSYLTYVPTKAFGPANPGVTQIAFTWVDAFDSDGDGIADFPHFTRVYAGQADPVDESHFSIPYQIDGGAAADVIDGYLQDDGSVCFTSRSGPSTRPALIVGLGSLNLTAGATTLPTFPPAQLDVPPPWMIRPRGDLIDDGSPRRRR